MTSLAGSVPVDLFEKSVEVWQRLAILECWKAISTNDLVYLLLSFTVRIRVAYHRQEEGDQGAVSLVDASSARIISWFYLRVLFPCQLYQEVTKFRKFCL